MKKLLITAISCTLLLVVGTVLTGAKNNKDSKETKIKEEYVTKKYNKSLDKDKIEYFRENETSSKIRYYDKENGILATLNIRPSKNNEYSIKTNVSLVNGENNKNIKFDNTTKFVQLSSIEKTKELETIVESNLTSLLKSLEY